MDADAYSFPKKLVDYLSDDGIVDASNPSLSFLAQHPSLLRDLNTRTGEPSDETGTELAGYQLDRLIAHGGCASVYESTSPSGDSIALKLSWQDDSRSNTCLQQEISVVQQLQHPNLLAVLASGEVEGRVFAEFELLPGPSMAQLLACSSQRREPTDKIVAWFVALAEALAHVHESGLVHRDVKPGNIVLDAQGQPRLIDFGLAILSNQMGGVRELAGTLPYMSPEQTLGGLTSVGASSDVYSLAVTAYELLTGDRVAERAGRARVLESVAFVAVPRPSLRCRDLPRRFDAVFAKALCKDPAGRYQTGRELHEDLVACQLDEPLPHAVVSVAGRFGRWTRQHQIAVWSTVAAAAIALAVWLVLTMQRASASEAALHALEDSIVSASRFDDTLELLDDAWQTCEDHAALRDLLLRHHATLGRAMTQRILRTTGLKTQSPSPAIRLAATAAERIHALCGGADFVLLMVWSDLMHVDVKTANARLHSFAESPKTDRRLAELAALIAAESGDPADLKRAEQNLQLAKTASELTVTEQCLRAFRQLHRVLAARRFPVLSLTDDKRDHLLDEARRHLNYAIHQDPSSVLARTAQAMCSLQSNDFVTAERRFSSLCNEASERHQKDALRLYRALAQSLNTGSSEAADDDHFKKRPGAAWWLACYAAIFEHHNATTLWITRVDAATVPKEEHPVLLSITNEAMQTAVAASKFEQLHRIGNASAAWLSTDWDETARNGHADLLLLWGSVSLRVAAHLTAQGHHESASQLTTHAAQAAAAGLKLELPRRSEFEQLRDEASR